MALTVGQARRLELAKTWMRPAFMYCAIVCMLLITVTVCYRLWVGIDGIEVVVGLLMTIFAGFSGGAAALIGGRSFEKVHDNAEYPTDQILPDDVVDPEE